MLPRSLPAFRRSALLMAALCVVSFFTACGVQPDHSVKDLVDAGAEGASAASAFDLRSRLSSIMSEEESFYASSGRYGTTAELSFLSGPPDGVDVVVDSVFEGGYHIRLRSKIQMVECEVLFPDPGIVCPVEDSTDR